MTTNPQNIKRLKYVASINDETLPENTDANFVLKYIDIGNVDSSGEIDEIVEYKFEDAPSRARRKVKHGDVIISTVRTYLKAIASIQEPPENLIVSTGFAVVRPFSKVFYDNYCKYVLREPSFIAEVEMNSVGVSYPAINASDLANLFVPIPPLDEQRAIAAMLDRETARLDELITEKERLLELLAEKRRALITNAVTRGLDPNAPLVDSGVEWLGEIPRHWQAKRLKYLVELINEVIESSSFVIAVENIESETGRIVNLNAENVYQGEINSFQKGDVLFNKLRPYLAKVYLAEQNGGFIGELLNLRSGKEIYNKFLYYRVLSSNFISVVDSSATGTKMPRANWDGFINQLLIPLPSLEEQQEIVEYIEAETGKIDRMQAATGETVELLKERRSSLIAAAVTGKISVREMK